MCIRDSTSSIDTRTEVLIQNAMNNLMQDRTSFVIAHRLSTIRDADLILVMKDGDIIEQGNHKELLEKKGFYAEDVYKRQGLLSPSQLLLFNFFIIITPWENVNLNRTGRVIILLQSIIYC